MKKYVENKTQKAEQFFFVLVILSTFVFLVNYPIYDAIKNLNEINNDSKMTYPFPRRMINDDENNDNDDNDDDNDTTMCPQQPCNLSLVFIGDSLTRFMYVSLAYYLRHNQWVDPNSIPNMVRPKDFFNGTYDLYVDWTPFYNYTTKKLYPYETCDCHRQPGSIARGAGKQSVCENRYYFDPHRNNTLVYLQAFTPNMGIRGHFEDPNDTWMANEENRVNISKAVDDIITKTIPFTWHYDWPDAITEIVAKKLKPEVLVINAGKWRYPGWELEQESYLNRLEKAIIDANIPRTIWKTTTASRGNKVDPVVYQFDNKMCQKEVFECFNITEWTSRLPAKFYIDGGHFDEPVYRKMNELLLFDHLGLTLNGDADSNSTPSLLEWGALELEEI